MSEVEACFIIKKLIVSLNRIHFYAIWKTFVHYFQKEKIASNEQMINEKFRIIEFLKYAECAKFLGTVITRSDSVT